MEESAASLGALATGWTQMSKVYLLVWADYIGAYSIRAFATKELRDAVMSAQTYRDYPEDIDVEEGSAEKVIATYKEKWGV